MKPTRGYPTSILPFAIAFADLGLPAEGAAEVTADTFLFLPSDISIDRVFLFLEGATGTVGQGSASVGLVQGIGDGAVQSVIAPIGFNGSETEPVEALPAQEHLALGRPVYCRVIASCPSSGGTPWYQAADLRLNGTIHFHVDIER